jgi:hypothetical protein
MKLFHFIILLLTLNFVALGTESRSITKLICTPSSGSTKFDYSGKKGVLKSKGASIIVSPNHHRYLFRSRSWSPPVPSVHPNFYPEIWSGKYATGWDHTPFLTLRYFKDGKAFSLFNKVDPNFEILESGDNSVKLRFSYVEPDLSCSLIFSYRLGDHKIKLQVLFDPAADIEKYELTFRGRSVENKQDKKALLIAGQQELRSADGKVEVDPQKVCCFIYTSDDSAKNRPYALVAMPGQAESIEVKAGSFYYTIFTYSSKVKELTFFLYDCRDYAEGLKFFKHIEVFKTDQD